MMSQRFYSANIEEGLYHSSLIEDYPNPVGKDGKPLKHTPIDTIFKKPPCLQDINQGRLGDCHLLSSLAAILALPNGKNIIRSMFDEEEKKVTVRLFTEVNGKLTPRLIRIDKSIPNDSNFNSSLANWVYLIEKAYVVSNGSYYEDMFKQKIYTHITLRTLTGVKDSSYYSPMSPYIRPIEYQSNFERHGNEFLFYDLMYRGKNVSPQYRDLMIERMFDSNLDAFESFSCFTELHLNEWIKFVKNRTILTLSDLKNYFDQWQNGQKISIENKLMSHEYSGQLDTVLKWLKENNVFQDTAYSPHYPPSIRKSYEALKEKFNNNQPIVLDTLATKDVEGIYENHAYAVVGFEQSDKTGFLYVRVKNPQNRNQSLFTKMFSIPFGRVSIESLDKHGDPLLQIKTTSDSEFLMEYTDFLRSFPRININQPITVEHLQQNKITGQPHPDAPDLNPSLMRIQN